jgi:hypothetical protein
LDLGKSLFDLEKKLVAYMLITTRLRGVFLVAWLGLGLFASTAWAGFYSQVNLVSDIPGFAAIADPKLKNPWRISRSASSPFWVSDQGTNLATLYRVTTGIVSQVALNVAIATTGAGPQGPTGQVNNNTTAFPVPGAPAASIAASFIFADLNGTIDAWRAAWFRIRVAGRASMEKPRSCAE